MPSNPLSAEATAKAKFQSVSSPAEILQITNQVASVVKAHPDFPNAPDVQQYLQEWLAAADDVGKNAADIKASRLALAAQLAKRAKLLAAWKRVTATVVAAIGKRADGSAEAVKKWGLGVTERSASPATDEPPTGLRSKLRKDLSVEIQWDAVPGHYGYFVQQGDGSAEGWGVPVSVTRTRFLPTNLVPGQLVAFRVAVLRRNGRSPWSDAISLVVR